MSNLTKHEDLVDQYLREGKKEAAIDSLLFLITKYSQQNDFTTAEGMRDRISSIDPMALHKSLQAQEIINSSKENPSATGHMGLWDDLYELFNQVESNQIYELMNEISYSPGETIFEEGGVNSNLYFLDQGNAKHIYTRNFREIFIKKIKPGDIAGEENFFEASYCTTTLVATSPIKIQALSAARLVNEAESYQSIFEKLKIFCAKKVKIEDFLQHNALDRREHKRITLEGSILVKPAKAFESKSMRGSMRDISIGGISLYIQSDSIEHAQMLLGHDLSLKFYLPPKTGYIEKTGQVLSIQECSPTDEMQNRFSIHVRFKQPMDEKSFQDTSNYLKMFNITD